jgi:serine/threonine protein kinase
MNSRYSELADVYSYGIVCWELLTRRCPYEGLNQVQVNTKDTPVDQVQVKGMKGTHSCMLLFRGKQYILASGLVGAPLTTVDNVGLPRVLVNQPK